MFACGSSSHGGYGESSRAFYDGLRSRSNLPRALDWSPIRRAFIVADETSEIARQLVELRIEHRDLDNAIARLAADASCDELQLKRMKKRKLQLKDTIAKLESKLIPDLDA